MRVSRGIGVIKTATKGCLSYGAQYAQPCVQKVIYKVKSFFSIDFRIDTQQRYNYSMLTKNVVGS